MEREDQAPANPQVIRVEDGARVPRQQVLEWELMAGRRLIRLLRHAMGAEGLLLALRPYIDEFDPEDLADDRTVGRTVAPGHGQGGV